LDEEKKKELRNYIPNVLGGMEEETVYNTLKDSLKSNEVKNTVVVNGWKEKSQEGNTKAEFDVFIISEPYQTIFHIEVKSTCTKKNCFKAAEQLERGLKLIQDKITFPKEEHWKFIKMMYFGRNDQKGSIFCSGCQKFVLGPGNDIWTEISGMVEKPTEANPSKNTYLNVLKFLLFEMYKQEGCATAEQLTKETRKTSDAMSTAHNIFFWSKEQLNVIKATRIAKRVALTSEFGTGKTILLKEKAKEVLGTAKLSPPNKQTVVFIIFEGEASDCILKQEYDNQFRESGAAVHGIQGNKGDTKMVLFNIY
jgi:hypothetical protein